MLGLVALARYLPPQSTEGAPSSEGSTCEGLNVVVWRDTPLGCDLRQPQALIVLGLTEAECADANGHWFGIGTPPPDIVSSCQDVDYNYRRHVAGG